MIRRLLLALAPALAAGLLLASPTRAVDSSPSPPPETPAAETTDRDQVSFGSDIAVGPGETARDVVCIGCSVTVAQGAAVGRDLVVVGGSAYVSGSVGRDLVVVGGTLQLGPAATVERDAVAVGGGSEISPGARIGRDRTLVGFPSFLPSGGIHLGVYSGLALVAVAVLALLVFPRQLEVTAALAEGRPGASLGLGCLTIIAAVAASILLGVTVILIPLSLVIALAVLAAWIFGWAAIYLIAGRRLLAAANQPATPLVALVVGGVLFTLLGLVPVVGFLLVLFGGALALGAAAGSRFGTRAQQTDFFTWRTTPPTQPVYPVPEPPQEPPEGNT